MAILFTFTTYGTWLRGDPRNWTADGTLFPPNPALESYDRSNLKHPPYYFPQDRLLDTGEAIGDSLVTRLQLKILALTLQTWHAHLLIAATEYDVAAVAKCAKDAARYHLRPGRPIWSDGYDKRFCFDRPAVATRIQYVNQHNVRNGWGLNPFRCVTPWG